MEEPLEKLAGIHDRLTGATSSASANPPSRWPEWSALALYLAVLASAIPFHEPWVDEAQAWQLARSLSLSALFKTFIRYEGSPGLWHLFLWLLSRAHVGYFGLHWICGAIAAAAVSLLIFASPLPRYLRLTLPFTFLFVFQYAIVARNYVLVPLLLFLVARQWRKSPLTLAVLLGLLANASLHAAVISGGLAIVYAIERVAEKGSVAPRPRLNLLFATLNLLGFYFVAIVTAWPPRDLAMARVLSPSHSILTAAIGSLVWAICDPWILSIPFWIVVLLWFHARRKLVYLLPIGLFLIFAGVVHGSFWHAGLLVPLLIALLWITWPAGQSSPARYERIGQIALIVMTAMQLLWSGSVLLYEHCHPYSPDRAAAKFLAPFVQSGATIAVTYFEDERDNAYPAVGILPYFDHNIFVNQPYSFWWWSDQDPTERRFNTILPSHPRIVVVEFSGLLPVSTVSLDHPKAQLLLSMGYRHVATSCATQPDRLRLGLTLCHVIFEYGQDFAKPAEQQNSAKAVGP